MDWAWVAKKCWLKYGARKRVHMWVCTFTSRERERERGTTTSDSMKVNCFGACLTEVD